MPTDLHRRALSCLLLGWVGPRPPAWLLHALEDGLGGVVLFGSNLGDGTDVGRLTAQLRAAAGRDIVIALDEEGGDVTRLDTVRGSSSPGAAALGHRDDPDLTESVYRAIGARCAAAGVTVDLAPVADVNVDPRNPVIGVRAFSADPLVAARHVAAAVRGLESTGVAACLKHFPGHGATVDDSHHRIATVTRTRAELDATELPPFRAGIEAGARAVMTGHLQVPALDPERIATLSSAITRELLRRSLGFAGTVVTDALEMRAVADGVGMVEGAIGALAAGADAIETGALDYPHLVEAIPEAIVRAVDEGGLDEARVSEASERTAELARAAERAPVPVPDAADVEIIGALPRLDRPLVVECRTPGGMASGELPWSLGTHLAALLPGTEIVRIDHAVELPRGRDLVVVVRDPDRVQWQRTLLPAATVVVDCGWPGAAPDRPTVRTRGIAPGLLAAAARSLAEAGTR